MTRDVAIIDRAVTMDCSLEAARLCERVSERSCRFSSDRFRGR
jgi:hypothetical protein